MWLAQRETKSPSSEAPAEDGLVTLEGEKLAVYVQGERRGLPIYGPGGCCWRPAAGDRVLVLKLGQEREQCCVAGTPEEAPTELEPGELLLRSRGGASIWLKNDGTVNIVGNVTINGEAYKPCTCKIETEEAESRNAGGGES